MLNNKITFNKKKDSSTETIRLLELQGSLQIHQAGISDVNLGEFAIINGAPMLYIGNHVLHGSTENLKSPVIVCSKSSSGDGLTVETIIREKYMFKTRPDHITSKR